MTIHEDAGRCLATVARSARGRRDLFVARDPVIAERLDQPIKARRGRGVLGVIPGLRIGTGLEDALGEDWFPQEAWGAWSAVERAILRLALAPDVTLPATLRLEFCAVIGDAQVRRIKLWVSAREAGSAEYVCPDSVVAVSIEITEADLGPARELDLTIEIDGLVSPAVMLGGGDARMLGPGLIQVSVAGAPEGGRRRLGFQVRRLANILRRVRARFRERGLARGGLHLIRAALRRLS